MKIDPRQMEKMARQMGMQMETIDATEVIIRTNEKDLVIENPQVSKIVAQGQETFQISGKVIEVVETEKKADKEDIELIVQKAGVSEEEAEKLLEETGDLALAIKKAQE
ncbi:MAG: nascent polypeptide-associated complex protein [Candidatus Aenigmarchaeota archaeon]|nr:nascent polypeptide-associated complex protein [Candidatus Aenigmarchaeota archaeon]